MLVPGGSFNAASAVERRRCRTASRRARGARNNRSRARWCRRRCRTARRDASDARGCGVSVWNMQQRVDELIQRIDEHATGLARQRDPCAVVAGERARVRRRGQRAPGRAAAFQYDHRLPRARRAQHSNSRRPSLRRFDVDPDHSRLRIGEIELEQVGGRHVGAVADGDQAGKLQPAIQAAANDVGAEPAALRDRRRRRRRRLGPSR